MIYALSRKNGSFLWTYIAGGRVDSPPTIYKGLVIFGSDDGRVYCLRSSDGKEVWKFLAAPYDRRIGYFDRIASTWPVHGSVLIKNDTAYFSAGRSTYLDGGIRFYGLKPETGEIVHKGVIEGPYSYVKKSFFITGANSDVLVSEGENIFMRQKVLTDDLKEIKSPVLSGKGAQNFDRHIFSTAGLLDGSWYNRTFWMYASRWPGFQLANQSSKSGQLVCVDDKKTYGIRVFYRRNVHSPMFFPGKEGYLLFADDNDNEPHIVGEEGARKPVEWLPESDYVFRKGTKIKKLDSKAFGTDKLIGYTRSKPPLWKTWVKVRVRGMVKAGDTLYAAGNPDEFKADNPFSSFEAEKGAKLIAISADDGKVISETDLESTPIFDGMIAAYGALYITGEDGTLSCLGGE